ncbi:MAG: META domain-containing protein [Bacteroidales bacterium]|jgi:heat shock protein HslJ|nr:META domain-containing protein [Bacteroidales bacterium]
MKKILFFSTIVTAFCTIMSCSCRKAQQTTATTNAEINQAVVENAISESPSITGTRWKLVEINGKSIAGMTFASEPFIEFDSETNRVSGNSGCNNFSGEMELNKIHNSIRFSKMITTRKACIDMSIETQLMEILSIVDNYSLSETSLSLNKARMAPLARFEVMKQ